ncbi:MAG: pyridoxamine 5'-phosphate oxidase family protein [Ktedonobacteraceae bacterium]
MSGNLSSRWHSSPSDGAKTLCAWSKINLNNPKVQKILQSKEFAHLATIRRDGSPQSSPMWFVWDGEYIKFTHTTNRKKYHNYLGCAYACLILPEKATDSFQAAAYGLEEPASVMFYKGSAYRNLKSVR